MRLIKQQALRLAIFLALTGLMVFPAGLAGAGPDMDASLIDAFGHLGLNEYDSMEIINRSADIEDVTSFRFAANLDPATIASEEAAWGFPTRIGVTLGSLDRPKHRPIIPRLPRSHGWSSLSAPGRTGDQHQIRTDVGPDGWPDSN